MTTFVDHFSAVAAQYASARPDYPPGLFDWIGSLAPSRGRVWEAGCGSGQATRGLAAHFDAVLATDPSAAQIAQASGPANVTFAIEPAERCSAADASVDASCVAQALHWFDRDAFFVECRRVLRPRGVLVVWGYQDIRVPAALAAVNAIFQRDIQPYWPAERAVVDAAYAEVIWPFDALQTSEWDMTAQWTLPRLLDYFASYSASKRYLDTTGIDAVAEHAPAFAGAWGNRDTPQTVAWPLFVHACRAG